MNYIPQTYAMPAPRHYAQMAKMPRASSSRIDTPSRPSPISTPAISDATSDSFVSFEDAAGAEGVRCNEENLLRTLGLSPQDIHTADVTSWEAPSFAAWLTQRRAQEARDQFDAKTPRVGNPALNPYAGEFIPMAARMEGPLPSKNGVPLKLDMGVRTLEIKHPWMAKFRSGSVTLDAKVRVQYARAIVRMGTWDGRAMRDLATKFAERVSESDGNDLNFIAMFAKAINRAFVDYQQTLCAQAFRLQLARCMWTEFEAFWDPSLSTSILCPGLTSKQKLLRPALLTASFVGELYSNQLVHGEVVYHCLNLLVSGMRFIEQLRATRMLLIRLDYQLLMEDPRAMDSVLAAVNRNVGHVGHSALGEVFDLRTVQVQVQDIAVTADRWNAPGPLERRARAKEAFSDSGFTPRSLTANNLPLPPVQPDTYIYASTPIQSPRRT
ncbi:hypothetical protein C2E23DRAFT_735598 [Lenzites betulinus]|nr:hypothetical protein C2E23DRAFT_735598 [Lenzites betulinus]